jgi:hypothetical protein
MAILGRSVEGEPSNHLWHVRCRNGLKKNALWADCPCFPASLTEAMNECLHMHGPIGMFVVV